MKEKVRLKGKIRTIMFWPLALASVLVVMDLVVFCISRRAGAAVSVFLFFISRSGYLYTVISVARSWRS